MVDLYTPPTLDAGPDLESASRSVSGPVSGGATKAEPSGRDGPRARFPAGLRIGYVTSRFPKITETFILFEMQAVESLGVEVEFYPLWRERTKVMHDEARSYLQRAHFVRLASLRTLITNLTAFVRRPKTYVGALGGGIRANWGSRRYLMGFLVAFPKAVVFAQDARRRGVQHIHAHFASHPAAVAWVIHRLAGIPYSFTAHGSDLHRDQHMLKEKVAEADLVVAISAYNRRLILEHCGAEHEQRVRVIHCGTDTNVFQPRQEDAGGVPVPQASKEAVPQTSAEAWPQGLHEALQIACIGTLHEVKGQVHLIRACRLLRDRHILFRLHLIGDGPDEAKLRAEAVGDGIEPAIVFHGRCTRQELIELLREMDVVVAPSVPTRDGRREGIPVALMEAMSAGVAVVASALSGIPELVRHRSSGLLVPPGDATAIAVALEELASNPGWRSELAVAARQTVQREFDQRRCAARLVDAIGGLQESQR